MGNPDRISSAGVAIAHPVRARWASARWLAGLVEDYGSASVPAFREAAEQHRINGPFGHLDARGLTEGFRS